MQNGKTHKRNYDVVREKVHAIGKLAVSRNGPFVVKSYASAQVGDSLPFRN